MREKIITNKLSAESRKKKPAVNFAKCNIPIGAELVFIEDPAVKVTVESERKVSYNDEITSLSAVAGKIKGVKAINDTNPKASKITLWFRLKHAPIANGKIKEIDYVPMDTSPYGCILLEMDK